MTGQDRFTLGYLSLSSMLDKAGIVDYRKDMQVHDSKRYMYVCVYICICLTLPMRNGISAYILWWVHSYHLILIINDVIIVL